MTGRTARATSSSPSQPLLLVTLLLGTFVTGCAELLAVGLLPLISADLGVSLAATGGLVTANALGLALGGPLLAAATIRLDRRPVLLGSMTLFAVLTVAPAVVPHFGGFTALRLVAGALQGLFMAAAFTTATSIAAPERAGRALGIVIAGFSIATVVGLPLGVLGGSLLGWRGTLVAVGALACVVAGVLLAAAPSVPSRRPADGHGWRQALAPRVLAVLALSLVLFAAEGAVLTYIVPLLEQVAGVTGPAASVVLLGFGVASVAGSFLGGRLADLSAPRALIVATLGLTVSFAVLYAGRAHPLVFAVAVIAWSLCASSAPPSIQYRVDSFAGPAGALAASLPASAAYGGIALGSFVSGRVYMGIGLPAVIVTGVVIALAALVLAVATRRLRPPVDEPVDEHPTAPVAGPARMNGD